MRSEKEIVEAMRSIVVQMHNDPEAPNDFLFAIVRSALGEPLRAKQFRPVQKKNHVAAIIQGALQGLMALDCDIAKGAVQVVRAVVQAAEGFGLDSTFIIRWCMVGVAQFAAAHPESAHSIRDALNEAQEGVGELFDRTFLNLPINRALSQEPIR